MELAECKANETLLSKTENIPLMENKKTCFTKLKEFFNWKRTSNLQRTIILNGENVTTCENVIKNHRYNLITFIPFIVLEQLRHFSTAFYVALLISQFFDPLKVGYLADYLLPVLIVFTITFIKEGYDDYHRYKKDIEANNQQVTKLTKNGREQIQSRAVRVGDYLEIHKNERIPADMIVIQTKSENGSLFIRTDGLDGETDWKLRKAPNSCQKLIIEELLVIEGSVVVDPPSSFIYEFKGVLSIKGIKDPLNLENTLWANTVNATTTLIGLVIYTGKETRAQANSSKPKAKFGKLDEEVNIYNKILFLIMLLLALSILIMRGLNQNYYIILFSFVRFVVLFNAILPISVRVNLEIAKTINSYFINKNKIIKDTIVRNSTIPEELGRIELVFTDKTGTLTTNEMKFKALAFNENFHFSDEEIEEQKIMIKDELSKLCYTSDIINSANNSSDKLSYDSNKKRRSRVKERGAILTDAVYALALCNNVTPINNDYQNEEESPREEQIEYQASSPDELALVEISRSLGMTLIFRDDKTVKLVNAINNVEEFSVLALFPFSSETKRMGIIIQKVDSSLNNLQVKNSTPDISLNDQHNSLEIQSSHYSFKSTNQNLPIFYSKGSESVMMDLVRSEYSSVIKETTENLANKGLRTLVVARKILTKEFCQEWLDEYREANSTMESRQERVKQVMKKLENNLDFLCVTGVEDKLQSDVHETISCLTNAGIKIWMLTGDKVETASCVAVSTGIKQKSNLMYYIKEDPSTVKEKLEIFRTIKNHVLVIDGECLDVALKNHEALFFKISLEAPAVVCCRCSPTQKARIVARVRLYTHKRTLAIGDGGNDVAMIQESHCGVGIVGKEGRQASLAADFSITEFHHLRFLLLWFGRQAYKNTSTICLFVIQRGMLIAFMQYIFCLLFYYVPLPLYNGFLVMGYTSIYTNFPVFSLLLDRDTKVKNVIKFPPLYKVIQKGRELNFKTFLFWAFVSLFQASVIMFGSIALFKDEVVLNIISITFTNLIFAELLNIYTQIKHFHWLMLVSLFGTLVSYFLTLFFLTSIIDFNYIIQGYTLGKIFSIAFVNWLPFFLHRKIKEKYYPEHHEKLNKLTKSNENA